LDYEKLSRETLIHEIKNLNKTIEKLKFERVFMEKRENDLLQRVNTPVVCITSQFEIKWANQYTIDHFEGLSTQKCYEVFYQLAGICPGCPMKQVLEYNEPFSTSFKNPKNNEFEQYTLYPYKLDNDDIMILEIHHSARKQISIEMNYKKEIKQLKKDNADLSQKINAAQTYMEIFSKNLLSPIRSIRSMVSLIDTSKLPEMQREYFEVMCLNNNFLYDVFTKLILSVYTDKKIISSKKTDINLKDLVKEIVVAVNRGNLDKPLIGLKISKAIPKVMRCDEVKLRVIIQYMIEAFLYIGKEAPFEIGVTEIYETLSKIQIKITFDINTNKSNKNLNVDLLQNFAHRDNQGEASIEDLNIALGVQIAKNIIDEFQGILEIDSSNKQSIAVTIFLTFDKLADKSDQKITPVTRDKKSILIIDQNRPTIPLTLFENYDIYFAKTGKEGYDLFKRIKPELVMIDVLVEDYSGFQFFDEAERIRMSHQKIIAVSNKMMENERRFMKDYGFDDYFVKPLTEETLTGIFMTYLKSL